MNPRANWSCHHHSCRYGRGEAPFLHTPLRFPHEGVHCTSPYLHRSIDECDPARLLRVCINSIDRVLPILSVLQSQIRYRNLITHQKSCISIPLGKLLICEATVPQNLSSDCPWCIDLKRHKCLLEHRPVLVLNTILQQTSNLRVGLGSWDCLHVQHIP